MNIRQSLSSMCYREVKPGKWLKPVGLHIFSYEEDKKLWSNWFKDATGKISLWQSEEIVDGDFIVCLKELEAYSKPFRAAGYMSDFELQPEWKYILENTIE